MVFDPISRHGPDFNNNKQRLIEKDTYVDATFLTTDPKSISFKLNNSYFIPNLVMLHLKPWTISNLITNLIYFLQ